ncbi:SCO6745 family protein [Streptomyces sp. NPDC003032]
MSGSRACVATTKDDVRRLGGSFMKSPEARQAAADLGMSRHGYYFRGRGGVLGPVTADVTAAVFGFFPLEFVRTHCAAPQHTPPPPDITARYAESCRAWGRRCLAGFSSAARLAELMETVADRVEVPGIPLFAGWRDVQRPDDAPARVVQLAHLLREHRGGLHLSAVLTTEITPLEATLTRDNGLRRAEFLGWQGPYPRIDGETHARRAAAEELTDRMAAPAYEALSACEADELSGLLRAASALAMARHRSAAPQAADALT